MPDPQTVMKQEVARAALAYVESGMVVGLGSGSTAALFIEYLGDKLRYKFDNSMSRGTPALIAWLTVATVVLIVVFSVFTTR